MMNFFVSKKWIIFCGICFGIMASIFSTNDVIGSEKGEYIMKLSVPYHTVNVIAQGRYEIIVNLYNDLKEDVEVTAEPCCGTSVAFTEGNKIEKGKTSSIKITASKPMTTIDMSLKGAQKEYTTELVLKRVNE